MDDKEWYDLIKDGADEGWKLVWERVVEPESKSMRSAEMMERFSLTAGDLMGMLFDCIFQPQMGKIQAKLGK